MTASVSAIVLVIRTRAMRDAPDMAIRQRGSHRQSLPHRALRVRARDTGAADPVHTRQCFSVPTLHRTTVA